MRVCAPLSIPVQSFSVVSDRQGIPLWRCRSQEHLWGPHNTQTGTPRGLLFVTPLALLSLCSRGGLSRNACLFFWKGHAQGTHIVSFFTTAGPPISKRRASASPKLSTWSRKCCSAVRRYFLIVFKRVSRIHTKWFWISAASINYMIR